MNKPDILKLYRMFAEWASRWMLKVAIYLLKLGPIPQHIGFIMDGNRRFAKRLALDSHKGHALGFKQLEQVAIT